LKVTGGNVRENGQKEVLNECVFRDVPNAPSTTAISYLLYWMSACLQTYLL